MITSNYLKIIICLHTTIGFHVFLPNINHSQVNSKTTTTSTTTYNDSNINNCITLIE